MEGITLEQLQVVITGYVKPLQAELQKAVASVNQTSESIKQELDGLTQKTKTYIEKSTSGIERGIGKATHSFRKMKLLAKTLLSVTAIVSFGKSCIDLGSDLTEVQNVVDVTFTNMSDKVNAFAQNAITSLGLSETAAKRYTSTMGAMLKSMEFAQKDVYDMSTQLTGLAADMASFYNIDAATSFTKIRSGIGGEIEPLRQLGINMSVANMEAFALSQGITKTYNNMSQKEQTLLRYNYLMKVTADVHGDFARTNGNWANQVRVLTENFNAFRASIGAGLINAFTPVLTIINTAIARLHAFAGYFNEFTRIIFGDAGGGNNSIASAADNITDSFNGTTASVKEAKRALMGFDEINKLSSTDTEADSMSDTLSNITAVNIAMKELDNSQTVSSIAKEWAETFKGVFKPAKDFIEDIKNGDFFAAGKDASQLAVNINNWIADAISNIDAQKIGGSIGGFLSGLASNAPEIIKGAIKIGEAVLNGLIKGLLASFEEAPIETILFTSAIVLKFTGLGKKYGGIFAAEFAKKFVKSKTLETIVSNAAGAGSYKGLIAKGAAFLADAIKVTAAAYGGFSVGNWLNELITGKENDMTVFQQIGYLANSSFSEISEGLEMTFKDIADSIHDFFHTVKIKIDGETIRIADDTYLRFMDLANDTGSDLNTKVRQVLNDMGIQVESSNEEMIKKLRVMAETSESEIAEVLYKIIANLENNIKTSTEKMQTYLNSLGFTEFNRKLEELKKNLKESLSFEMGVTVKKNIGENLTSVMYGKNLAKMDPFPELTTSITFAGAKAEGGLVPAGQMFIAREAGPELVGTMGGHTAVANNTQIISGIEGGVARAIAVMIPYLVQIAQNTRSNGKSQGLTRDDLFKSVQMSARSYTERTGLNPFPI